MYYLLRHGGVIPPELMFCSPLFSRGQMLSVLYVTCNTSIAMYNMPAVTHHTCIVTEVFSVRLTIRLQNCQCVYVTCSDPRICHCTLVVCVFLPSVVIMALTCAFLWYINRCVLSCRDVYCCLILHPLVSVSITLNLWYYLDFIAKLFIFVYLFRLQYSFR